MRLEPFRLHYQDVQQRQKSFLIYNTNKCTIIEMYTFTNNPVRLLYTFRSSSDHSQRFYVIQSYMRTQMNYQTD